MPVWVETDPYTNYTFLMHICYWTFQIIYVPKGALITNSTFFQATFGCMIQKDDSEIFCVHKLNNTNKYDIK